jgi:hypothetical protein
MGVFSDAAANAMTVLFDADRSGAIAVTYDGTAIKAHVRYHDASGKFADLLVKKSDVPDPAYNDPVVIDGNTWRVYQDKDRGPILEGGAYTHKILIHRSERPTPHGP